MVKKTRRNLLKLTPMALVPMAGCSGDSESPTSPRTDTATSSGQTSTDTGTQTETETTTRQNQSASVVIGESVAGDQMSMVVKSLSKTESLGQYQQAREGNTYAVVRLEVKNTTRNEYANFSSFLQTQLKDGDGYTYDPTLSTSDSTFQGGQLAPGEVARGDIPFEIPKDATDLSLVFDFSAFSFFQFERVRVDLSSTAEQVADLEQSLHVPIHSVGDSVTHDGITVAVNDAEFRTSLGQYTQAPDGREYAIVDVTTKNRTDEVVSFSSLLQMSMKDGTGRSFAYSAAATSQLTRQYSGGKVGAGQQVRGKVAFEVPKGVSSLYFTFEYSVISGGSKTFWKIR